MLPNIANHPLIASPDESVRARHHHRLSIFLLAVFLYLLSDVARIVARDEVGMIERFSRIESTIRTP